MPSFASSHQTPVTRQSEQFPGILGLSDRKSLKVIFFRNRQQLKSWKRALNLLGLRQVTYTKAKHFHGMVFRKPCQEIQQLTAQDVREQNQLEKIENMFYIPQDFATGSDTPVDSSLDKLLHTLDRDIVVSDFHELPSLDF